MPLFLCEWDALESLLVDDVSKASATDVGAQHAGVRPSRVLELPPRVFVAQVTFIGDDDDVSSEDLVVEPLDHSRAALFDLVEPPEAAAPPKLRMVDKRGCKSEALDADDVIVTCTREADHAGQHAGAGGLVW